MSESGFAAAAEMSLPAFIAEAATCLQESWCPLGDSCSNSTCLALMRVKESLPKGWERTDAIVLSDEAELFTWHNADKRTLVPYGLTLAEGTLVFRKFALGYRATFGKETFVVHNVATYKNGNWRRGLVKRSVLETEETSVLPFWRRLFQGLGSLARRAS